MIDRIEFDIACRRKSTNLQGVAQAIGRPASTLSAWLRNVCREPEWLQAKLEKVLKLPPGSLSQKSHRNRAA